MTEKECCVLEAIAGRICIEVAMAVEKKDDSSKALDHLAIAQEALVALRYKLFQKTHISGTCG